MLKLAGFSKSLHMKMGRMSALHTGQLYPQGRCMVLISESTLGPKCGFKVYVSEGSQRLHRESKLRFSGLQHSASTDGAIAYPT